MGMTEKLPEDLEAKSRTAQQTASTDRKKQHKVCCCSPACAPAHTLHCCSPARSPHINLFSGEYGTSPVPSEWDSARDCGCHHVLLLQVLPTRFLEKSSPDCGNRFTFSTFLQQLILKKLPVFLSISDTSSLNSSETLGREF